MLARDVMSTDFFILTPDALVHQALEPVWENRRRELPVVEEGRFIGVLTMRELIHRALPSYIRNDRHFANLTYAPDLHQVSDRLQEMGQRPVREVMSREVRKVSPDTALLAVATALIRDEDKEARNVWVVDDGHKLVGQISEWEVLRHIFGRLDFSG
ncbi:MAG: HPP family protein [Thiohalorhabdus sp.]|uniref:CBS domain-containing protein n=1 Tax=Thiohalorhabdus sp. TaxID=3094134 RepID=UPI00397F7AC5